MTAKETYEGAYTCTHVYVHVHVHCTCVLNQDVVTCDDKYKEHFLKIHVQRDVWKAVPKTMYRYMYVFFIHVRVLQATPCALCHRKR